MKMHRHVINYCIVLAPLALYGCSAAPGTPGENDQITSGTSGNITGTSGTIGTSGNVTGTTGTSGDGTSSGTIVIGPSGTSGVGTTGTSGVGTSGTLTGTTGTATGTATGTSGDGTSSGTSGDGTTGSVTGTTGTSGVGTSGTLTGTTGSSVTGTSGTGSGSGEATEGPLCDWTSAANFFPSSQLTAANVTSATLQALCTEAYFFYACQSDGASIASNTGSTAWQSYGCDFAVEFAAQCPAFNGVTGTSYLPPSDSRVVAACTTVATDGTTCIGRAVQAAITDSIADHTNCKTQ